MQIDFAKISQMLLSASKLVNQAKARVGSVNMHDINRFHKVMFFIKSADCANSAIHD